jgi:hypothetical protein
LPSPRSHGIAFGNNFLGTFETLHKWAFGAFAELIQNADDAGAKKISIQWKPKKVLPEHLLLKGNQPLLPYLESVDTLSLFLFLSFELSLSLVCFHEREHDTHTHTHARTHTHAHTHTHTHTWLVLGHRQWRRHVS